MSDKLIEAKRIAERLFQQKRFTEAKDVLKNICEAAPNDAAAWLNYGAVTGQLGDLKDAETAFRRVLQINPNLPQGYYNLGKLLVLQGRAREAETYWRKYVGIMPALSEGHHQLANVLMDTGRVAESLPYFHEAMRLSPNNAETLLDYASALQKVGRFSESESIIKQMLAVTPEHARAYLKLANLYTTNHRYDESADALRQVLRIDPGMKGEVLQEFAVMARRQGDFRKAMGYYDEALSLRPDNFELRWERSLNLLLLGHFQEGLSEYEARTHYWKYRDEMHKYILSKPRWDGGDLEERTILIYAEQGFGDSIQFSRYLPLIADRGGEVIFYCYGELSGLLKRLRGVKRVEVLSEKILTESFAVHASIMSLPHLFRTQLDTIPAQIPYLYADTSLTSLWRERIDSSQLNVGLVWAGRSTHPENYWRSMSPQDLFPLADSGAINFYSLQKDLIFNEYKLVSSKLNIKDLSRDVHDFDDTAAIISNLDLIITVDTAVAHLAGALGRPVWTLVHFPPDWRWMMDREDSPWYPTMRLFRRGKEEAWVTVIQRVSEALVQWAKASGKSL